MNRRLFTLLFAVSLIAAAPAMADKGKGGGGGGGGGGDDKGGGNSGRGGGGDDDDHDDDRDDDDQSWARRAVDQGKAEKLSVVLKTVRGRFKGDVVDVKLHRFLGRLTYRIKLLEAGGTLLTVTVDATSGQVLRVAGGR